jgi:hypothetical protein
MSQMLEATAHLYASAASARAQYLGQAADCPGAVQRAGHEPVGMSKSAAADS